MPQLEWRVREAGYCCHPEVATRRGGSLRPKQFPALAFELMHPEVGRMLFDTGYSDHFLRVTEQMPERLYRIVTPVSLQPGQSIRSQLLRAHGAQAFVSMIMVSHFHGDHIGGLPDFPDCPVYCSRVAWSDIQARGRINALRHGLLPTLLPAPERLRWWEELRQIALPEALSAFGSGFDLLGDGSVIAISLPGHASGHYGIFFEDHTGSPVFLVGDAAWSSRAIRENVLPPRLVTDLLGDTNTYQQTLFRLHSLWRSRPDIKIVPSHCPEWREHVTVS